MKKPLKLPDFKNEVEEQAYWAKINLVEYFEPKDFGSVTFPNLKPTSQPISIRLPNYMLAQIKEKANETGVAYQALIKTILRDAIKGF